MKKTLSSSILKVFILSFVCFFIGRTSYAFQKGLSQNEISEIVELSNFGFTNLPLEDAFPRILMNDSLLYKGYAQGAQSITNQFINFVFPTSGKEKRVEFLPYQFWGQKKPQYKEFKWKLFESQHFNFYTYGEKNDLLNPLVRIFESYHESNSKLFGVDNRIQKKIPIILYRSRADFSQTHTLSSLVPESLGGFTELVSWKRLIFPFEGDKTTFEHVARHEGSHVYHVAKQPKYLPLWLIEGTAEMNSIKWNANAETVIRDAYFNNFMFHIPDLWRIQGTWLMYKEGNLIANHIAEKYGMEAIRKLFNNGRKYRFKKNIKESLGIELKDLDSEVFASLNERLGKIALKKDEVDNSKMISKGKLLAARGDYFITGKYDEQKFSLHLNYLDTKRGLITKQIIADQDFKSESLHMLKSRADIDKNRLMFAIQGEGKDEIRIVNYSYSPKKGAISLGYPKKLKWENISHINDPVFVGEEKIAFIGFENEYSAIYIYDLNDKGLKKITSDNNYYKGLDYSPQRDILVFSKEEERIDKMSRYNFNLYSYDFSSGNFTRLTDSVYNDLDPEISPDGSKIAFVGDKDDIYNIFFYDLDNKKVIQATDVKVAALAPRWRDNQKLYFGTVNKFEAQVHKLIVPTLKIAFSKTLPIPAEEFYRMEGKKLIKKMENADIDRKVRYEFAKSFLIEDEKLYLKEGNRKYLVKKFLAHQGSFIVITEPEKLRKWEKIDPSEIFSYSNGKVLRITDSYEFQGKLDSTILNIIDEFSKDKSVIDMWISPDAQRVVFLVNNVLSFENKKKAEQSLYVINVKDANIKQLPYYGPLKHLKDKLSEIYFLKGDKLLLKVDRLTWNWKTYSTYYLYSNESDKFRKIYSDISDIDISLDSRLVLSTQEESGEAKVLYVYDSVLDEKRAAFKAKGDLRIVSAHFIEGNNLFIAMSEKGSSKVSINFLDIHDNLIFEKKLNITPGYRFTEAISSATGENVALKIKNLKTKTGIEKLYSYTRSNQLLKEIGLDLSYYDSMFYGGEILLFQGRDLDDFSSLHAYSDNKLSRGYAIDLADYSIDTGRLVVSGGEDIISINLETGDIRKIIDKSFGFDVWEKYVVLSSFTQGFYNLFLYDLENEKLRRISKSWFNELNPKVSKNGLAYTVDEEKRFSVHVRSSILSENVDRIYFDSSDVYNPKWINGDLYFNLSRIVTESVEQSAKEIAPLNFFSSEPLELSLKQSRVSNYIRPQYVFGGLAYDGNTVLIFLSLAADNIFSDRGIFVNTVYRTDFINSTIGYTNLEKGRTYTLFLNQLEDIVSGGFSFQKSFIIDRFRQFNMYSQVEYLSYEPDEFNGDTVEFPGRNVRQYLVKTGAVYSYDATIWDFHGPSRGARLFSKVEIGINVRTGKVSNVDANVDFRLYNQFLPRIGLAHRLMGGTSRGDFPTTYFLGGNISFRGVAFDGLKGNNYWAFSEDLRIPIFDFIGAVLPGPVDYAIGPFFKFFDVRGGLYYDVGQAWFNKHDNIDEILQSFGFFLNTPTLFGLTMRFSKGILGRKGFNIWFGSNW